MVTSRQKLHSYLEANDNTLIEQYYALLEKISLAPSADYLNIAAQQICEFLDVRYAMITEGSAHKPHITKTLVFYERNQCLDNIEYVLKHTPCETVFDGKPVVYADKLQQSFPKDKDIVAMNAVSYAGHPIYSADNFIIGHIAIMHDQPLTADPNNILSILNLLSIRLGTELERRHSEYLLSELASDFNLSNESKIFDGLVKKISKTLDVDVALIGKLDSSTGSSQIEVISAGNEQTLFPAFSYPLPGTPCEIALQNLQKPVIYKDKLQQHFPDFELFKQLNTNSYVGMSLLNRNKQPIGIIGVIHSQAIHSTSKIEDVLSVFSVVASEELENLIKNDELERYKAMSAVSSDCMCLLDTNCHFVTANDAYLNYYNLNKEDIVDSHYQQIHGNDFFDSIRKPALEECLKGKNINQEFWRIFNDTERKYIKSTILPYYDTNQEVTGYLITDIDITEQKLYDQLNALQIDVLRAINTSSSLFNTLDFINIEIQNLIDPDIISAVYVLSNNPEQTDFISCPKSPSLHNKHIFSKLPIDDLLSEKITDSEFLNEKIKSLKDKQLQYCHIAPVKNSENKPAAFIILLVKNQQASDFIKHALKILCQLISLALKTENEEKALINSKKQYETLYHETPSMFYTIDGNYTVMSVNNYGANKLGYTIDEITGKPLFEFVHPDDHAGLKQLLSKSFDNETSHITEIKKHHKNGQTIYFRLTIKSCKTESNHYLLVVAEDVSEAYELSIELNYQATHDMMTGLINRVEFERRLDNAIQQCKENNHQHTLCYIDLDQFKIINDSCGHAAGDDLLKKISEVIQSKVRSRDTLARLGGDEFGLLMEHCTASQANHIVESIRQSVEDFRFNWVDKHYSVSTSMGLIEINQNTSSKEEIMSQVDIACYVAKEGGRNCIHIYSETDQDFQRHSGEIQWVSEINHALDHNQFMLFKQDIHQIVHQEETCHFQELLIRLKNTDGDVINPGLFLPAAEHFHLSTKIDSWVVETIFKYISDQNPDPNNTYFINLSGQSIGQERFLAFIQKLYAKYKIQPSTICFEITETAAISNLSKAIQFMNTLKSIGCLFALDDFGSGLSSFSYLKNLPVDFVKIDGSFIQNICRDEIDLDMVKSICHIVNKMNKVTIAEFVENADVLEKLKDIGVDYAQGYLLDKPTAFIS